MSKLKKLKSPFPHDMKKLVRGLTRYILKIIYKTLFPLKCINCNKEGSFLCQGCENKLRYLNMTNQNNIKSEYIGRTISCFVYKEPINNLIIMGKYSFMPEVFAHLAKLLATNLKTQNIDLANFVLCPIPLSKQRLRWRGFNQSEKLCETFSKKLGLPVTQLLIRRRNTKTQKDLSRLDRRKNVQNCFAVSSKFIDAIKNRRIILVDDVATTGATLNAAGEVLAKSGARTIWALTIARD